jgi:hypothetical protein
MKEQMGHIMTLIQQNPKLANIKQEVLTSKVELLHKNSPIS